MPKQSIVIATENNKAAEYITAYFQDTESIPAIIRSKKDVSALSQCNPDFLFFESDWADGKVSAYLEELKEKCGNFKCMGLGSRGKSKFNWDVTVDFPLDDRHFRKALFSLIQFPEPVQLVVVDDEPEILEMIQDYFEVRKDPAFNIRTAPNGLEGFKLVEQDKPHCMILDLKMSVRTGTELYRDLSRANHRIPTVIFIDSTAADDIRELRKWGMPVFVEKGGSQSSMPEMLALVKKLVAFS